MSNFNQSSFSGGINLLLDDTRLPVSFKYKEGDTPYDITYNQYRMGINIRNRFDVIDPIQSSIVDTSAPLGIKQGILTFGNYIILFCDGSCFYKLNGTNGWYQVKTFTMDRTVPRYWTVVVPLNTTNYARAAVAVSATPSGGASTFVSSGAPIIQVNQTNYIASAFGNNPGLLVQDGKNQPVFLYIDSNGIIQCRTTQTYQQWAFPLNTTTLQLTGPDNREYVPIGTYMEWFNGILFIVDNEFSQIYRSVSGRPLDFVINVDINGNKGGDATTTSFSVGVNGITALRAMSNNSLFVAAGGGACFSITLNTTPNAPTIFGEYTFIRTPLFNSNCINERGIIDVIGDTVFIDANGLRSFNAVEQQQNEGRNSVFSSTIQRLFKNITQQDGFASAVLFDNYAIFSVNTVIGYVLIVYDTINSCYSSIDIAQLNGHAAKQFASINITTLSLFAITDDDKVVQLYADPRNTDTCTIRLGAVCSSDPRKELKVETFRAVLSNITQNMIATAQLFTNNRQDDGPIIKKIKYISPVEVYAGVNIGTDINTQVNNITFPFPNSQQGWKSFVVLTWTGGASLTNVAVTTGDLTPLQPLRTQAVLQQ